jgi:ribosomal protein S18 acetylase RimI-like enzyme
MDLRSLGYRTDLALLQLGGTQVEDRGDHLVVRSPHNPQHYWGNFLLLDAVPPSADAGRWVERHADAFPGARHRTIGFDGTGGTVADLSGFSALGLSPEAQTVMTASSVRSDAPHREAECRQLSSDDDWQQNVELQMRCNDRHDPVVHRAYAEARARTHRRLVDAGHGGWFGAFVEGRLVCQMGLFSASPGLARFQSVETDPGFRRRGIARALVQHVSTFGFEQLAATTLVMVADPDYFAIDLYRSVGFAASESQLQAERLPTASATAGEGGTAP